MDEIRAQNQESFNKYAAMFSSIPGVKASHATEEGSETWAFSNAKPSSHLVNLTLTNTEMISAVDINIEDTDMGYLNIAEETQSLRTVANATVC